MEVTHFGYIWDVFMDAFSIGCVSFAISYSMAKIMADRNDYKVNPNQVMTTAVLFKDTNNNEMMG